MKKNFVLVLIGINLCCLLACAAQAEQKLNRDEIRRLVAGKTVTWVPNGGQSYYGVDGYYRWMGPGKTSEGTYHIQDGAVCMKFTRGGLRCDAWYKEGASYYIKPTQAPGFPSSANQPRYNAVIN